MLLGRKFRRNSSGNPHPKASRGEEGSGCPTIQQHGPSVKGACCVVEELKGAVAEAEDRVAHPAEVVPVVEGPGEHAGRQTGEGKASREGVRCVCMCDLYPATRCAGVQGAGVRRGSASRTVRATPRKAVRARGSGHPRRSTRRRPPGGSCGTCAAHRAVGTVRNASERDSDTEPKGMPVRWAIGPALPSSRSFLPTRTTERTELWSPLVGSCPYSRCMWADTEQRELIAPGGFRLHLLAPRTPHHSMTART